MSSRDHAHLNNLTALRFLVIDEADRMVQQGSFPQLERILEAVHTANPLSYDDEELEKDLDDDNEQNGRLLSLPGVRGESRVTMLGDIMKQMDARNGKSPHDLDDIDVENKYNQLDDEDEGSDADDDEEESLQSPLRPPVYRQTFVFSATLTLPPSENYLKKMRKNKKGKAKESSLTGAIAEILERAHTYGKTKVVDLTSSTKFVANEKQVMVVQSASASEKSRLPPGLTLQTISCTQKHKDSHLYAYLVTTAQGSSGPCLIFCNSIAAVKRVGITLQTLRLPVRTLHASMPQVRIVSARFPLLEWQ
jgi:ATP-dependent RNA helicase DDX24/MAK5